MGFFRYPTRWTELGSDIKDVLDLLEDRDRALEDYLTLTEEGEIPVNDIILVGTGLTKVYNSTTNTVTISYTGGSGTDRSYLSHGVTNQTAISALNTLTTWLPTTAVFDIPNPSYGGSGAATMILNITGTVENKSAAVISGYVTPSLSYNGGSSYTGLTAADLTFSAPPNVILPISVRLPLSQTPTGTIKAQAQVKQLTGTPGDLEFKASIATVQVSRYSGP